MPVLKDMEVWGSNTEAYEGGRRREDVAIAMETTGINLEYCDWAG